MGFGGRVRAGKRGAMKREKCMYGFQFRIFMRSGHSGGAGKEGKEGRPERILCYASIEKWEDQRGEGWAGEEPGPAAGIHVEFAFSIFSAWAKAPAQQPVSRSPWSAWNGIARLRENRGRSERFLYYLPNPLSQ